MSELLVSRSFVGEKRNQNLQLEVEVQEREKLTIEIASDQFLFNMFIGERGEILFEMKKLEVLGRVAASEEE